MPAPTMTSILTEHMWKNIKNSKYVFAYDDTKGLLGKIKNQIENAQYIIMAEKQKIHVIDIDHKGGKISISGDHAYDITTLQNISVQLLGSQEDLKGRVLSFESPDNKKYTLLVPIKSVTIKHIKQNTHVKEIIKKLIPTG